MKRDVGRERGRGKKVIGQGCLRSRFAAPVPRTDSDRLTDSAEDSERAGARARRRTKGPGRGRRGRAAAACRRPATQDAGARTVPLHFRREGGAELASRRAPPEADARGVAKHQAPPATATEVGGGPAD